MCVWGLSKAEEAVLVGSVFPNSRPEKEVADTISKVIREVGAGRSCSSSEE